MSGVRALLVTTVLRGIVRVVTTPTVCNRELLDCLETPVVFAVNHSSHLDASLVLTSLPRRFRDNCIIAAGADYWFDVRWKARLAALSMNIIPIERERVGRKSADLAAGLINEGWNVIIFPEGTRSRDGFASPFRGGAAYLALRCNVPVVPIHLDGTRRIFGVGARHVMPGPTRLTFGTPLFPVAGMRSKEFSARIEEAVALCADEAQHGWWNALKRNARRETPSLQCPPGVTGWRRNWLGSAATNNPVTARTTQNS